MIIKYIFIYYIEINISHILKILIYSKKKLKKEKISTISFENLWNNVNTVNFNLRKFSISIYLLISYIISIFLFNKELLQICFCKINKYFQYVLLSFVFITLFIFWFTTATFIYFFFALFPFPFIMWTMFLLIFLIIAFVMSFCWFISKFFTFATTS